MNIRRSSLWRVAMHALRPLGWAIPSSIYSRLWFEGSFEARVGGGAFKMYHHGAVLENEVFWRGTFLHERAAVEAILPYLKTAEGMLDVGANTGFFSLLAKAIKPDIRVVALEPSRPNYDALRRNILLNDFDIVTSQTAATEVEKEVTLYDFPGVSYSASLESDFRDGTVPTKVRGSTIDVIASEHDLLGKRLVVKIDVEGHEASVLRGATALIESNAVFLVEIIRPSVAKGVSETMIPGPFVYMFLDEATGVATDKTSSFSEGLEPPWGNYLIFKAA